MSASFLRVGLTGGIATGKSSCLRRFSDLGAATIDADIVARDVVAPGTPGFDAVVKRFGATAVTAAGVLDRAAIGRVVFADVSARQDLERIVHPAVYDVIQQWFERQSALHATARGPRVAIADIPLLFETNRPGRVDRVVVAACPADLQLQRLMARDGLSEAEASRRIAAQLPIEDKRSRADFVIDTSGSLDDTNRNVDRVWAELQQHESFPPEEARHG